MNRAETLAGVNLRTLQTARDEAAARGDMDFASDLHRAMAIRSRSQTPELEHCGQLFEHVEPPSRENGNRFITRYTGDPMAWMGLFMTDGARGTLNRQMVRDAQRGGTVQRVFVPNGKTAAAI